MRDVRVPASAVFGRGRPRARARAALRAREPDPPSRVVARRRRSSASTRPSPTPTDRIDLGQAAVAEPGDPVPARRAAHRSRDAAPAHPLHRVVARPPAPHGGHAPRRDVQLPGEPLRLRRRRPGDADLRRASATAATCRSSTSTATIAATASPKAPKRSRCARSASSSSASAPGARADFCQVRHHLGWVELWIEPHVPGTGRPRRSPVVVGGDRCAKSFAG